MPSEKYKILEFYQGMKSDEMKFIIYADLKYLIIKNRWMCTESKDFFYKKNRRVYSLWIFNFNNMDI